MLLPLCFSYCNLGKLSFEGGLVLGLPRRESVREDRLPGHQETGPGARTWGGGGGGGQGQEVVPSPGPPKPQRRWAQSQKTPSEQRERQALSRLRPKSCRDCGYLRRAAAVASAPGRGGGRSLDPRSLGTRLRGQRDRPPRLRGDLQLALARAPGLRGGGWHYPRGVVW